MKRLDQSVKHCLCRDSLKILFAIAERDLLEERDDEVKQAAPQGGIELKNSLKRGLVLGLNGKSESKGANPKLSLFPQLEFNCVPLTFPFANWILCASISTTRAKLV